ncbi:hypothetical protein NIM72_13920 [Pantoea sp. B550]|uniref:DUF5862 domain-containing protein n=1 Tax=Candidatus Pantoea gossypiicola TaxID=2608008 RepID=A0AB34CL59_9GAMM|nr:MULTISPECIES: hypothetical protein [Pantoea]KAA5928237.1 hypothetical protein F3I59_13230 [Pantoea sp. VH_8]KAA5933317.1 hypothetical protein F3I58_13835 [Pantoea sp. VH_4]KAA5985054.1 hypothetical protein F3I49_12500 [Pantoea sp. M_4]KAA6122892.1 hypothetical protein F3I20_15170 [Pantoea gossypiicola]MCP1206615.1 hypothetical protein [Pantoea sp. B550]
MRELSLIETEIVSGGALVATLGDAAEGAVWGFFEGLATGAAVGGSASRSAVFGPIAQVVGLVFGSIVGPIVGTVMGALWGKDTVAAYGADFRQNYGTSGSVALV